MRKYYPKERLKSNKAYYKSYHFMTDIWRLWGHCPSGFAYYNTLRSLELVLLCVAVLLGRYPMNLECPTSWGLQYNPGFTFTASPSDLLGLLAISGPSWSAYPAPCIVWSQWLSLSKKEDFTIPLLMHLSWPMWRTLLSLATCFGWILSSLDNIFNNSAVLLL